MHVRTARLIGKTKRRAIRSTSICRAAVRSVTTPCRCSGTARAGGKKKGADSEIDGFVYFKPDGKTTEKAIVSVKGGENVSVSMIRDMGRVVDREKAKVGIFITLADATGPMKTEAVKAGFYETPHHGKVPKLQILTIADLFAGKKPQIPFADATSFKAAPREVTTKQEEPL